MQRYSLQKSVSQLTAKKFYEIDHRTESYKTFSGVIDKILVQSLDILIGVMQI